MTSNQMKTAVRAISQNIMNTKYNQIICQYKMCICKTILLVSRSLCEPPLFQQWKNMSDVHVHQPVTRTV